MRIIKHKGLWLVCGVLLCETAELALDLISFDEWVDYRLRDKK